MTKKRNTIQCRFNWQSIFRTKRHWF